MITGEDLELFARSLERATSTCTGAELDAALVDVGWHDALAVDRRAAVSLLFELQGRAGTTSSALHDVVGSEVLPLGGRAVTLRPTPGLRPVGGLDPLLGMFEAAADAMLTPEAVAAGRLAVSHELVGASRTMLQLAGDHAVERIQFGRPISSFQAVRHRLADSLVAVESADAALGAAWDEGTPMAASIAKAVAGRSARLVARHCQQVLAGIGFTTEHPLHLYVKRTYVLDRLLGDSRSLTQELGTHLLATKQLPAILPL